MTKAEIIDLLISSGRMSAPTMYTYSNAKRLPGGGYGYCVVSMTKDTLYVSDVVGSAMEIGDVLCAIPVSEMKDIRHSPRITLNPYLRFTWRGEEVVLGAVTADMKKALGLA